MASVRHAVAWRWCRIPFGATTSASIILAAAQAGVGMCVRAPTNYIIPPLKRTGSTIDIMFACACCVSSSTSTPALGSSRKRTMRGTAHISECLVSRGALRAYNRCAPSVRRCKNVVRPACASSSPAKLRQALDRGYDLRCSSEFRDSGQGSRATDHAAKPTPAHTALEQSDFMTSRDSQ